MQIWWLIQFISMIEPETWLEANTDRNQIWSLNTDCSTTRAPQGQKAINFLPGGVLSGFNNSVFTIFILIYSSFIFYPPAYWPPLCNAMQCKDHYHLSSSCLKAIYGIGFCFQDSTSSSYIRRINHLLIHGKWSSLIPLHSYLYPSFNKSQPSEEKCQNLNDQFIWLIDLLFPSLQAKSSNIWIKIA